MKHITQKELNELFTEKEFEKFIDWKMLPQYHFEIGYNYKCIGFKK